jgi:hypothetical protein
MAKDKSIGRKTVRQIFPQGFYGAAASTGTFEGDIIFHADDGGKDENADDDVECRRLARTEC